MVHTLVILHRQPTLLQIPTYDLHQPTKRKNLLRVYRGSYEREREKKKRQEGEKTEFKEDKFAFKLLCHNIQNFGKFFLFEIKEESLNRSES